MSDLCPIMLAKLEKIESDVNDVKVITAENTADLKHHIKRTNDLQDIVEDLHQIVTPLHEKFVSEKAVEEYKKKQREDLIYKLKLPGYILVALTAIGSIIAWLGFK